MRWLFSTVFE